MSLEPVTPESIEAWIDAAASQYMSASGQAVALTEQAVAALAGLSDETHAAHPTLVARTLRVRGLALHYAGRHADGLAVLNEALDAVPADDLGLQSSALRALSIGCELLGDIDNAVAWATRALAAARASGDPRRIADALLSLGISYSRAGDAAAGLAQFDQVLAIFEADGDTEGCVSVLNNMGINCKNLGRHADSVAHFTRALALAETVNAAASVAVVRSNLGESLMLQQRLDESRAMLALAAAALQEGGHHDGEINARVNLGRVLHALGDASAQAELEQALRLCERSGSRNHAARAHLALAALHKQAGRFETALQHHEAYHAAERAQFNAESDRKIHALRAQREVADARHEADMHRLRHVEIASAHDELKALHAALVLADEEKNHLLARLAEQSRTDALTGLANRRALDERLMHDTARARRHAQPLAVALCDLDFFKRVNDRLGHATGDTVLRRVAALLRERCRGTDLVARYGGEEFCIVFEGTDAERAHSTCEALREAVAAHPWREVHAELAVTLSIGISDDPDLATHEQLLAAADRQLYRAKHEGKNRVCWRGNEVAP
jgi:diguanylate cyclase (GGDEF)-like protein